MVVSFDVTEHVSKLNFQPKNNIARLNFVLKGERKILAVLVRLKRSSKLIFKLVQDFWVRIPESAATYKVKYLLKTYLGNHFAMKIVISLSC